MIKQYIVQEAETIEDQQEFVEKGNHRGTTEKKYIPKEKLTAPIASVILHKNG